MHMNCEFNVQKCEFSSMQLAGLFFLFFRGFRRPNLITHVHGLLEYARTVGFGPILVR